MFGIIACFLLAIFVLIPLSARLIGPATLVVMPLALVTHYLWRCRKLMHDYAHQEVALTTFTGSQSASFTKQVRRIEELGFELHSLSALRLDGKLWESKPIAFLHSQDSFVEATALGKRLGFVTELEDGRWLVTANRRMIAHPRVVRFVVKSRNPATVLDAHMRRLARLTDDHGIASVKPMAVDTTALNRAEQERLREHFADGRGIVSLLGLYKIGKQGDPLMEPVS